MATFYLDNDVPVALAAELRGLGHSADHTRDLGGQRACDALQLVTAVSSMAILLTLNGRDFKLLQDAWYLWPIAWQTTARHFGILVLPQRRLPLDTWAQEIDTFVQQRAAGLENRLHHWRSDGRWEPYQTPGSQA